MFTKILIPVEGSAEAASLLSHAVAIAKAYISQITLLHLLEQPSGSSRQGPVDPWDWQVRQIQAESHLKSLTARLEETGVKIRTDSLAGKGRSGGTVYDFSKETDLVVLSGQYPAGFNSWQVNPAVLEIIQRSNASVLVARSYQGYDLEPSNLGYQRIMVPLDGSLRAEYGLNAALHLARHYNAELLATHVVKPPEMPRRMPLSPQERDLMQEVIACNQKEASRYLENLKRMLDVPLTPCLMTGMDVAKQLYTVIQQQEIDLVVLNAHGFTGDAHWPYGSLAVNFMLNCPVPVLVVQDFALDRVETLLPSRQEVEEGRRVENFRLE
jgi:nucleotide-binding universal stress UspA family protein